MIQKEIIKINFKSRFCHVCCFAQEGVPESHPAVGKKPYSYFQPDYVNAALIYQHMLGNTCASKLRFRGFFLHHLYHLPEN